MLALIPTLLQAESVLTDSVDKLTNKRVVQLDVYSNETKNVVVAFCLKVDEGEASVHLVNKSLGHVFFPDDYRSERKVISYRSSSMSQPNQSAWSTGLHQLKCLYVRGDGERWRPVDFAEVCRMITDDELVLSITEDEKRYTFDLTTDSVRDMRNILIAKGEHLVRLGSLREQAEQEERESQVQVNLIINAGSSAAMARLKRSSRKPSKDYVERIAPNLAKKAGYTGVDASYFVSGFVKTMGY